MLIKVGHEGDENGDPLYLTSSDLKAHAHGIGASRAGKSKLVEGIVRQLIKERHGVCLIDPGGFLYQDLLQWLAYTRPSRSEIVLFDPSYEKKIVGFNPLRMDGPKTEATISAKVDRIVALTTKALGLSDLTNAPRLERIMRCLYYVLIEQDLTLEAVRCFLSPRHLHVRDMIIDRIQSETIKDQWLMFTHGKRPEAYLNMVESTANRLFKVLTQPSVKRIFGVLQNSIDIGILAKKRGTLLVNLQPSLSFSQDAAQIIGTFLVNEIWETVRKRTRDEMRTAPQFYLIVDEFQSFATPDFGQILDQGAKYGLHLILFHQNLNQLDSQIRTAMTACHSRFVFGGVTTSDAGQMLEGSIPTFENLRDDISLAPSLPARHYILKRPDRPLVRAYTPEVQEYRAPEAKVEKYTETMTAGFLSPEEVDAALRDSVPIPIEAPSAALEAAQSAVSVDLGQILTDRESAPTEPLKPVTGRKPEPFDLTYDRARGTVAHKDSQTQIASVARELGFKARVEKPILNGAGFIDVALEKGDIRIACEVSITSGAAWETKNVTKCLAAGYERIWVVAFPKYVASMTTRIRNAIPVIEQAKFKVLNLGECFSELQKLAPKVDPKTGKPVQLAGQWLTVMETAEFFKVNKTTIYRWKNEGRLPYQQVGRKILFDRELLLLLNRHNLTGKQRTKVELDKPIKIEKPKSRTKKQENDRYRKMLDLD